MKKLTISLLLLSGTMCAFSQNMDIKITSAGANPDSAVVVKPEKKSFFKNILKPFKWIGKNWSAYDPEYCLPCAYDWVVQLQNTTSMEWLDMSTEDGIEMKMHSKMSNRIGPYLGYSFLMYGMTVDLNALSNGLGGTKGRSEFTLSINSNLVNIDIIRRRTGGDFEVGKLTGTSFSDVLTETAQITDMTSLARSYDIGSLVNYDVTGFNINYFVNHKRYSNPAAYTNGQLQIKSAGSWILGFGYTHQRTESDINDVIVNNGMQQCVWDKVVAENPLAQAGLMNEFKTYIDQNGLAKYQVADEDPLSSIDAIARFVTNLYDKDSNAWKNLIGKIYNTPFLQPYLFGNLTIDGDNVNIENTDMLSLMCNGMPSVTTVDDYNLHIGYAYNWVLSRRWLLGFSLIAAPGIKHIQYDNRWSMINLTSTELSDAISYYYTGETLKYSLGEDVWNKYGQDEKKAMILDNELYKEMHESMSPNDFKVDESLTRFGCDFFGRASVVYTKDRWRAGLSINLNSYIMRSSDLNVTSTYGAALLYVGYCFGPRKKMYRKGGSDYDKYINIIR